MLDPILINGQRFEVEINVLRKKHSSARIQGEKFVLRISSKLSKPDQIIHINSLIKQLSEKVKIAQNITDRRYFSPLDCLFVKPFRVKLICEKTLPMGRFELTNGVSFDVFVYLKRRNQYLSGKIWGEKILIFSPHWRLWQIKKELMDLIYKLVAKHQRESVSKLVHSLNKKFFQEKINQVVLKNNASRWGSCSGNKNINLATRLLFLPYPLLEYVCVHELAHLIIPNHSQKFWALVRKNIPDYQARRALLRNFY